MNAAQVQTPAPSAVAYVVDWTATSREVGTRTSAWSILRVGDDSPAENSSTHNSLAPPCVSAALRKTQPLANT